MEAAIIKQTGVYTMIYQAVIMARELTKKGIDNTIACIQAADHFGVDVQSVINAYLWG